MNPDGQQDLNARSDGGSFAAAGSLASLEQEVKRRRKNRFQVGRKRLLFTGLAVVFVALVLAGIGFSTYKFFKSRWFRQPADLFATQSLEFTTGDLSSSLALIPLPAESRPSQLGLNGDLRVGGNLSLSQQGIENLGEILTNKLDLQSDFPALAQDGNASITGTVGAAAFVGGGSNLSTLNATSISSGTIGAARLNPEVSLLGQSLSVTQIQPNIVASINGLTGSSGAIELVGAGGVTVSSVGTSIELNQAGGSSGITQLTLGSGLVGGGSATSVAVDLDSTTTLQGNSFNAPSQLLQLNGGGALASFDGGLLTNLSASALSSGTVDDVRLSTNVVLKDLAATVLVPLADSTSTFAVRNSSGSQDVVRADTMNQRVGIGYSTAVAPSYTLDINGDINVEPPSSTLLVGGVQICGTLTCAIQDGSASYVQNGPVMQSSTNVAIQSAGFTSIAGRIRSLAGQTANLLQLEDEAGVSVFEVSQNGSLLLQGEYFARSADTARSFSVVYDSLPTLGILRVDTDTGRVGLNTLDADMPQYTLDLGASFSGDVNLASGSVMRINGVAVCSSLGCSGDGSSIDYIRNSTSLQTGANFYVQSANAGGIAAVRFAGAASQSADILSVEDSVGDRVLSVSNIGAVELSPISNTGETLAAYDTIGNARFVVDTVNREVSVSDSSAYAIGGALSVNVFGNGDALVVNQTGSGDLVQIGNASGNVMQVSATGDTLFKTTTNATNAFSVMASSATAVLNADTTQNSINVGGGAYSSVLGVATSGTKPGQIIENPGSGDSLKFQQYGIYDVASISSIGQFTVQPSLDTSNAVRVKSSAGADVLQVSTGNNLFNQTPSFTFNGGANGEVSSWSTNSTNMNKPLRDAGYAYLNGYMYRIGGTQQASRSTFTLESEVARAQVNANGTVGAWTAIGTLNDNVSWSNRSSLGATAINGAIYTVGGYRFNSTLNDMHNGSSFAKVQSDGSLSSWTQMNYLDSVYFGGQRGEAPLVNDGYGNMYYLGGSYTYTAVPVSGVYRETIRGNHYTSFGSWSYNTGISALPGARAGHRAEIANGYLYAIGGYSGASGTTVQASVYYAKLNGSGGAGAWSTANSLPVGLKYHCSGVANGYMYVWGGDTGSSISNAIYYAKLNNDGSLGSWQTSAQTMPTGVASAGCAIINGRLYSFGGVSSTGTTTSAVYYAETSKVRMYADIDLIGLDRAQFAGTGEDTGSSLISGSAGGGSLFAGTVFASGSLQAAGSAQLTGGVAVLDRLSVDGDTRIRVNVNYAEKSVVVDSSSGSRVLTVDPYTSGETVGVNVGGVWGTINAKMTVNGVTLGQNLMQVTDTSNGTLQALTIADGGAATFTNNCSVASQCDETTAFQIQNASGTALFRVDTLNAKLTLGSASAGFDIDFEQNSANRSAIVRDFVCTSSEVVYDVVEFNGVDTVARTATAASNRVAGVVVTKPTTTTCTTAIAGVVQVNFSINGQPTNIGDPIETSIIAGAARATTTPTAGAVIGNAISLKDVSNRTWIRLRRD